MKEQWYTLGDFARELQIKPYTLHYMLACHKIAEPNLRIGSRRIWTEAEIMPIRETLKTNLKGGDHD